jgi:hypothetical protein
MAKQRELAWLEAKAAEIYLYDLMAKRNGSWSPRLLKGALAFGRMGKRSTSSGRKKRYR